MWNPSSLGQRLNWRLPFHLSPVELDLRIITLIFLLAVVSVPCLGGILKRDKDVLQYGEGLIVNIPLPEPEVAQVVDDVAQNTIIHGTKEYNKDEYIAGAVAEKSSSVFPAWREGGKVFYKVRKQALDPRNFKSSGDVGTLVVRYVVQPQGDKNTVLRIDALFSEDFRHSVHQSDGTVETSEYKDIQERLDAIELMKKENVAAEQAKQERRANKKFGLGDGSSSSSRADDTVILSTPPVTADSAAGDAINPRAASSGLTASASSMPETSILETSVPQAGDMPPQTLEQHVADLRRQVERLVKKPGAPLKSAPFHTASTLKSLEPGAEVLIVISTPYWYGVETHDGEHGWLRRDELEQVP
jgi:hypothetical protein